MGNDLLGRGLGEKEEKKRTERVEELEGKNEKAKKRTNAKWSD